MRYECDQCGACCKHLIIEIDEIDLIREPKLIQISQPFTLPPGFCMEDEDGEPVNEVVPGYGAGAMLACGSSHPCQALGPDNRCTIYPTRPNACVAFRAGSQQCQEARKEAGLPPLEPIGGKQNGVP